MEMKTVLVTLLAAVLCVEQGEPLMLLLIKIRFIERLALIFLCGRNLGGHHQLCSIATPQPHGCQLPSIP